MKRVFDGVIAVAAGFILTYGASFMLFVPMQTGSIFLSCLAIYTGLSVITLTGKHFIKILPFLGAAAILLYFTDFYPWIAETVRDYINWSWAVVPDPAFERLTVFLITFAVMLPVYILVRCRSPVFILLLAGGVLFYGLETAGYDYPVMLFWCYLLLVLLQTANAAGEKSEQGAVSSLRLLTVLPVCVVIVFAAFRFTETGAEPLGFIRNFADSITVFNFGQSWGTRPDASGIGSEMGGPFRPSGELMLTVDVNMEVLPGSEALYLRGGLGITYDGRRWYGDGFEGVDLGRQGLLSEWAAPVSFMPEYNITHVGLRGSRLYLPYNTVSVASNGREREDLVWYTGDIIRLNDNPGSGLTYTASALPGGTGIVRRSSVSEMSDEPSDMYLQLSRTLPPRIWDLAHALAPYEDDFYNALAIERYLVENFPYNPDMPETPDDEDFVDYFLFTQKEGYCVYFASAMTVLCRAAGIPARYVDGFAPSDMIGTNGNILYTDEYAHAWCEAYIEGEGWRRYEPTPGFNTETGPFDFPEPIAEPSPSPSPSQRPTPPQPSEEPSPRPSVQQPRPDQPEEEPAFIFPWKPFLMVTLPVLLLLAVYCSLRTRRKRFIGMPVPYSGKQAKRMYMHILWLAEHAGVRPKPQESLREFAARADEVWPDRGIMLRVVVIYEKTCYGKAPLTAEESKALRELTLRFEQPDCLRVGKLRYFLYRKVLFLI